MKTFGIHFCYKNQSDHSHEQVNIHINTSRKPPTVPIVKNHRIRHFLSIRGSILAAILMSFCAKFKMVYLTDGGCYLAKNLQQDIYQ